jgi:hypothetical protein
MRWAELGDLSEDSLHLYPDVIAAGGLVNALQNALLALGSTLTVTGPGERFPVAYARAESGVRFSQVYIAAHERLFLLDFWARGVVLAHGSTPNLAEAATAINRWVGSAGTSTELAAAFPFVVVKPAAAFFERAEEVECRWRDYLANIGDRFPELATFVRAAYRRPELRQLFPYTSFNSFCFSRCTGYPYTGDTPMVVPTTDGQYEVRGRIGEVLGRGDADAAVQLVIDHLPAKCGPAVPGTADELPR